MSESISFSTTLSSTKNFIPLRKSNPVYAGSKLYRDAVIGANIIRKAAQLVNDIERPLQNFQSLTSTSFSVTNFRAEFDAIIASIQKDLSTSDFSLSVTRVQSLIEQTRIDIRA